MQQGMVLTISSCVVFVAVVMSHCNPGHETFDETNTVGAAYYDHR